MQRLFFHNQHDAESRALFNQYQGDPEVTIYDVFGADRYNLPPNIQISYLPYMIDKEFVLTTPGPYATGVVPITIECRDYQGNVIVGKNDVVEVYVNDAVWLLPCVNGVISFELDCPEPMMVTLEIYGDQYLPFSVDLGVGIG